MAGGKGTRFGGNIEKPMTDFLGKPLILRVIEACEDSNKISGIFVSITSVSPMTEEEVKRSSAILIRTDGKGYHSDLQQAVRKAKLNCPVLIISADLPLINGKFLDGIISEYEKSGKPALTVLIPEKVIREYGLSSVSIYEFEGKKYAVSGINVIDGRQIKEQQEEEVIINCSPEAIFSINSLKDMELAKDFWLENQR